MSLKTEFRKFFLVTVEHAVNLERELDREFAHEQPKEVYKGMINENMKRLNFFLRRLEEK